MKLHNEDLMKMIKTGHYRPFQSEEEAIGKLAAELLRVRQVAKAHAPAMIVRGQRYSPDWVLSILDGEE